MASSTETGSRPHVGQPFRQDGGGGRVDVAEPGARLGGGKAGVGGVQHGLVDLALDLGERAVGRQGAGDVRGVERIRLDAGVEQQQLAGVDLAGVPGPVQHRGVVAGGRDGVVAELVAFLPGAGEERAFDDTLAALVGEGPRQDLDHLGEALDGGGDGGLHLLDFPLILEQAQFGEGLGELLVEGVEDAQVQVLRVLGRVVAGGVHEGIDVLVHLPHQPDGDPADFGGADVLGDAEFEFADVGGVQAEAGLEFGQGRAGADPELAGAGVGVELLGVAAGQRAEVQRGVVVAAVVALAFLHGFQDEHGVGLVVQAQAGEVREAGVRAEAVVAVVGADLQRTGGNDQAFAFELL